MLGNPQCIYKLSFVMPFYILEDLGFVQVNLLYRGHTSHPPLTFISLFGPLMCGCISLPLVQHIACEKCDIVH